MVDRGYLALRDSASLIAPFRRLSRQLARMRLAEKARKSSFLSGGIVHHLLFTGTNAPASGQVELFALWANE
jgi:hypothetical protein